MHHIVTEDSKIPGRCSSILNGVFGSLYYTIDINSSVCTVFIHSLLVQNSHIVFFGVRYSLTNSTSSTMSSAFSTRHCYVVHTIIVDTSY